MGKSPGMENSGGKKSDGEKSRRGKFRRGKVRAGKITAGKSPAGKIPFAGKGIQAQREGLHKQWTDTLDDKHGKTAKELQDFVTGR